MLRLTQKAKSNSMLYVRDSPKMKWFRKVKNEREQANRQKAGVVLLTDDKVGFEGKSTTWDKNDSV